MQWQMKIKARKESLSENPTRFRAKSHNHFSNGISETKFAASDREFPVDGFSRFFQRSSMIQKRKTTQKPTWGDAAELSFSLILQFQPKPWNAVIEAD
jgi:hypothetical protein